PISFLDALDEVETAAASLWADPEGPTAADMERLDRARQRMIECARALAGLRSDAQEEEDVGEVCDLCGEMFDPSELGTVIGPLGQDEGVPRWYRCPRCARAYDAGYQQGQRDPRGDETADPTAIRSDAQGEDRWEDLVFGPITAAYNEAHDAGREDGSGAAAAETSRLSRELEAARAGNRRRREALERVADGGCERFYGTDCWQMGMDPHAEDYADRVCDPCFARRALAKDTEVSNDE